MSRRSKQTLGDSPIGAVLRAIRVNRGLSLKETARLVGVSPANLSRTERGLEGLTGGEGIVAHGEPPA